MSGGDISGKQFIRFVNKSLQLCAGISILKLGLCLFFLHLATRLAYVWIADLLHQPYDNEQLQLARNLAAGHGYVNPWAAPTGPTAMYTPGHPLLMAALFKIFGSGEIGSAGYAAFIIQRILLSALTYAMLPLVAERLGWGRRTGFVAGLAGIFVPIHLLVEMRGITTGLEAFFMMLMAVMMHNAWESADFNLRHALRFGLCQGTALLFNPFHLANSSGYLAVSLLRFASHRRKVLLYFGFAFLLSAVILSPWAVFNLQRFGRLIWLRGDFGIQLYISLHPNVTVSFKEALRTPGAYVAPNADVAACKEMAKVGEPAYSAARLADAVNFARQDPGRIAGLIAKRFLRYWFPLTGRPLQTVMFFLLTACSLLGLADLWQKRDPARWLASTILLCFPLLSTYTSVIRSIDSAFTG